MRLDKLVILSIAFSVLAGGAFAAQPGGVSTQTAEVGATPSESTGGKGAEQAPIPDQSAPSDRSDQGGGAYMSPTGPVGGDENSAQSQSGSEAPSNE